MSGHEGAVEVTKVPRSRKPGGRYRVPEVGVPVSGRESSEGPDDTGGAGRCGHGPMAL